MNHPFFGHSLAADDSLRRPHDHPEPGRPWRLYLALTNHCNRACPWCSTHSSPAGGTWLTVEQVRDLIPANGRFQLQLEGGEPTVHPAFWEFVAEARAHPRCDRLVLCTNGVRVPRRPSALAAWVARLGAPLTIKLSVNHHLLDHDPGLLRMAAALRDALAAAGGERELVLNVRLRRGEADDDRAVRQAVADAGLDPLANTFFLQRYGLASAEEGWDPPSPIFDTFTLVNPDGQTWGTDLIARSAAMGALP